MPCSRILTLLAAGAVCAACTADKQQLALDTAPPVMANEPVPTGRLPRTVEPLAYSIDFTMNPDALGFSAHESIRIELTEPRDTIWLHGRGLDISDATLEVTGGETLEVEYAQVNDAGVVRLRLPRTVSPQEARIVLNFDTRYSPGLLGAYKVEEDGEHYVFTQFEPIAARRAFVSFDEPGFKTPFTYSFTVPKTDTVVANTPVEHKADAGNGMVKWQFMTTKPLPTYLVAWAVGPLDVVRADPIPPNGVRDRPIPLTGVTVKGKGEQIAYALAHTGEIVAAQEDYLGIAYPWRKLSLIAVPDFGAGAMENVGAITFRERLLLMDPDTAPTEQIRDYWSVNAHELAHMWFGDLVTVPWWNDIWLNEAFATWTAQKTMTTLHPEWHPKMDALSSRQYAMRADSLISARAIRQPIEDTGDIRTAFDGITYQKGAAVIAMFEHYLGVEEFQQGVKVYLEQHAYGSGELDGFLGSISAAAGRDIAPAFETFLNQPGLPLVAATLTTEDGRVRVHLEQSRYLPLGSVGSAEGKRWRIPVCMRYAVDGNAHRQCHLLTDESADVPLEVDAAPDWFMPNADGLGYYQWSLEKSGYDDLARSLDALSALGQMSLAGSIEAAFRAGRIDTAVAVEALAPLARSPHRPVAREPMSLIAFAHEWLLDGDAKAGAEAYARELYGRYHVAADFARGGAPEDANERQFEAAVADFLAEHGRDPQVRQAATAAAMRLLGLNDDGGGEPDLDAVAPEFIPVALTVAVQDKGTPVFDALYRTFRRAPSPFLRNATLQAMAHATDPTLARRARAMALEPGVLRQNELLEVVLGQLGHEETRDAAWQWLQQHFDALVDVLPHADVPELPAVARFFCSDAKAAEVEAFFEGRMAGYPGSERNLRQALESAHLCAARREVQSASAERFFGFSQGARHQLSHSQAPVTD